MVLNRIKYIPDVSFLYHMSVSNWIIKTNFLQLSRYVKLIRILLKLKRQLLNVDEKKDKRTE